MTMMIVVMLIMMRVLAVIMASGTCRDGDEAQTMMAVMKVMILVIRLLLLKLQHTQPKPLL